MQRPCFYSAQGDFYCQKPTVDQIAAIEPFYAPLNDGQVAAFGHGVVAALKTDCNGVDALSTTCHNSLKNQFNSYMNCHGKSLARCDVITEAQRAAAATGNPRQRQVNLQRLEERSCPSKWSQNVRTDYYNSTLNAFKSKVLTDANQTTIFQGLDESFNKPGAPPKNFASYERALRSHPQASTLLPVYKDVLGGMDVANMCDKPY